VCLSVDRGLAIQSLSPLSAKNSIRQTVESISCARVPDLWSNDTLKSLFIHFLIFYFILLFSEQKIIVSLGPSLSSFRALQQNVKRARFST
jgi:hypothetical protein